MDLYKVYRLLTIDNLPKAVSSSAHAAAQRKNIKVYKLLA